MTLGSVFKLILFISLFCPYHVSGISVEEDLTLTLAEKRALDKFKVRMIPKMPHGYMKTDFYLIRWLRAQNLNQKAAERMLLNNLRWRKENKIDTLIDEDLSDMTEEYGYNYTTNTHDKQDRPIWAANVGTWDVRRAALTGKIPRLIRLAYKCVEQNTQNVFKLQRQGKNVTQFTALYNMDGFNFIEHACPRCISTYVLLVTGYEEFYPGFMDHLILINTPPTFKVILDATLPLLREDTRKTVKIFGQDKKSWNKFLDAEISRDQRSADHGGTRKDR